MAWCSMHVGFWTCQFQWYRFWGCTFRCFQVMGWLYLCIILETVHHRTTFRIFCNVTLNTTSEENSQKIFHISSPTVLFSYGKVKDIFWDKGKVSSGKGKWKEQEGSMWEKPKMRVIFAKFPLLNKIQTLSHKLFIRQTSNHQHCDQNAPKPNSRDFQVILSSFSWSKTLCIFKEQIWLPKINSVLILSLNREKLSPSFSLNTLYRWLPLGG